MGSALRDALVANSSRVAALDGAGDGRAACLRRAAAAEAAALVAEHLDLLYDDADERVAGDARRREGAEAGADDAVLDGDAVAEVRLEERDVAERREERVAGPVLVGEVRGVRVAPRRALALRAGHGGLGVAHGEDPEARRERRVRRGAARRVEVLREPVERARAPRADPVSYTHLTLPTILLV